MTYSILNPIWMFFTDMLICNSQTKEPAQLQQKPGQKSVAVEENRGLKNTQVEQGLVLLDLLYLDMEGLHLDLNQKNTTNP